MIKILHGDNIAASRTAFTTLKQGSANPILLRGGAFTLTDLVQVFEGGELFSESKDVFIEDFFGKIKKGEELKTFSSYLIKHSQENTIILWEVKTLTKTQLVLLKDAITEIFKLPTALFTLLDGLRPGNATYLISQAQKVMNETGEEILFSMLARHLRLLLAIRERAAIEEVKRLAPWQKTKLEQQASLFSTTHLISLHKMIYTLDTTRKTGTGSLPLPASIDFFLLHI